LSEEEKRPFKSAAAEERQQAQQEEVPQAPKVYNKSYALHYPKQHAIISAHLIMR